MRVIVCGGRDYRDYDRVFAALAELGHDAIIIEGGATGADRLARVAARNLGLWCWTCPADWDRHGKGAGHIRNMRMLDQARPHLVIAFPGGRGTANMVEIARLALVEVRVIDAR